MGLLGPHSVIAPPPPAPTSSLARVTLTANGPGVQHLGRAMLTTKARGGGGAHSSTAARTSYHAYHQLRAWTTSYNGYTGLPGYNVG